MDAIRGQCSDECFQDIGAVHVVVGRPERAFGRPSLRSITPYRAPKLARGGPP